MPGGNHAINKSYRYQSAKSRAVKRKLSAKRLAAKGGAVAKPVVFSNTEPSKKRLRRKENRGLQRAIQKLKASGALDKAAARKAKPAARTATSDSADVDMEEAEHEVLVTATRPASHSDAMDLDDAPANRKERRAASKKKTRLH